MTRENENNQAKTMGRKGRKVLGGLGMVLAFSLGTGAEPPSDQFVVVEVGAEGQTDRLVVVAMDVTESFTNLLEACNHAVEKLLPNLGPNDFLTVYALGNRTEKPALQLRFPPLAPEAAKREWGSLVSFKRTRKAFHAAWAKSDSLGQVAQAWFREVVPQRGGHTDLWGQLSYLSIQFRAFKGEKALVIYSDLVQDTPRERSRMPPPNALNLTGLDVSFVCVPFESMEVWEKQESQWRKFFEKCGVQSFQMLDLATSALIDGVAPNAICRDFPRFQQR